MTKKIALFLAFAALFLCCVGCTAYENSGVNGGNSSITESATQNETDNEQILESLYDYGDFMCNVTFKPGKDWNFDIAYEEDTITIDSDTKEVISSPEDAQRFSHTLYKAKDEWVKQLRSMITDNMEKSLIDELYRDYIYIYQNEWYIKPNGGGRGVGLGQSELILDSYEKPDESTLILNFTSIGYKEDWGTDEDIIEKGQIILIKTEKGFLIEKCPLSAAEWFVHFENIKYESEYYPIEKAE